MKALVILVLGLAGCSTAWPQGQMKPPKTEPVEPCVAERIDGGVKITCPTSEAIVYDGEVGPSAEPIQGEAGRDGASCVVDSGGLVQCGANTYQLPIATSDECQVFILPKE